MTKVMDRPEASGPPVAGEGSAARLASAGTGPGRPMAPDHPIARGADAELPSAVNAMSVDVEDYFQVSAFSETVRRSDWETLSCRVERNVESVLQLFADFDAKATFFTLGWVAESYPHLIKAIVDAGHELASHGYEHVRVDHQNPDDFREDVRKTKALLEDLGGTAVKGYRAASFSITKDTLWAFRILEEEGYSYSSSVYPIRHDHYGIPGAPRFAYRPKQSDSLTELPITTFSLFGQNLPCGGGGYFRLLPYALSRWAMRRVNRQDNEACIFYFHPWEIDPEQPRVSDLTRLARFRHYTNLHRMERRLRRLLADFRWDRIDRVFFA